jgi:contractile injection system tape measure protein
MLEQAAENRVRRMVFDLRCPDQGAAFSARTQLLSLVDNAVLPALDHAMRYRASDGRTYRVDRVEIDLGRLDLERLDAARIRETIAEQLGRFLKDRPADRETAAAVSLAETLSIFLTTGTLPWHAAARSLASLEIETRTLERAEAERLVARLRPLLRRPAPSLRFTLQFSAEFLRWAIRRLQPITGEELRALLRRLPRELSPQRASAILLRSAAMLPAGAAPASLREQVVRLATEWSREARGGAARQLEDTGSMATEILPAPASGDPAQALSVPAPAAPITATGAQRAQEAWYVGHAGLILLHPFFQRLFTELGLLDTREQFQSPQARERAVHLLHFLASGTEHPEEHATLLYKLLCGMLLEHAIRRELPLRDQEKAEANELLAAAIRHWGKLGSTSPDGLREGFLARDGKIERMPDGWVLTVEQRSIDVLLDYLPWTLSIVRLPWMARPLQVNWV